VQNKIILKSKSFLNRHTLVFAATVPILDHFSSGPDMDIYVYQGPLEANDTYAFGNCTYWVSLLRAQAGDPIPNTWGNAIIWAMRARADGYQVDQTPTAGSIMQDPNAPGGLGHVAYVESVDPQTGSWTISEMNRVGFDEVDTRIMPAGAATSYYFIHDI
jgi:surface antigen